MKPKHSELASVLKTGVFNIAQILHFSPPDAKPVLVAVVFNSI